jgi:outer membrane cobalamin receptor
MKLSRIIYEVKSRGFAPRFYRFVFLYILTLAVRATASFAAVDMPEEVVVGSVIYDANEDKYLSPGMVTVIRPEERAGEQRNLPDLLEEVPGLRIIRLQGRHGYAVASVRGSTSAQVAVYVDGVLMNLQSESAVDLSTIPVDNVERIEVYRGYIPARFGAQAMGGVINIVTRLPQKPETSLSLGAGSFGRYKGTLSYATKLGEGKFFSSLGCETYNGDFKYWNDNGTGYIGADDYTGHRRDNGFENTDLLLKWEDAHWTARTSWTRRNRDLSLSSPGIDRPGEPQPLGALLNTKRWDLSLGRKQSSGSINWGWEVLHTRQEKFYDSRRKTGEPTSIGAINVRQSEYDAQKTGISLNANWSMGERHFMELLTEYTEEKLHVDGDMLYEYMQGIEDYRRADWNLNLQDTIAIDRAGTFLVTPSIRWHKLDEEDHFTWQMALTKEFSTNWMAKSTYGTYARSPNLYERYGDGAFILPALNDLSWETGKQLDFALIWNGTIAPLRNAGVNASLSAFWRDTDDLLEFEMRDPKFGRYINISKSEVKGIEFESELDWKKWNIALSCTWMEGINKTPDDPGSFRYNGMKLPNRPEWSGSARLTRLFGKGSVFAEYQYIGENYVDSGEKILYDARNLFNIGVKYDISPTTHLVAGVDDVFNDADGWRMRPDGYNGPTRMLWYPVEGRSYYMTLNMEF